MPPIKKVISTSSGLSWRAGYRSRTAIGIPGLMRIDPRRGRMLLLLAILVSIAVLVQTRANEFVCVNGRVAVADLGDGVVMRTCLWERKPREVIRTGPLELIKNDILILKTQTNLAGQLHGLYSSWDDSGVLMQRGSYHQGRRQGQWIYADGNGQRRVIYYRAGVPLGL